MMDATIVSLSIQQARKDPVNGQFNITCHNQIFFGLGMTFGSVFAAVSTEWFTPFLCYKFTAFVALVSVIAGTFLTDEVETNKYGSEVNQNDQEFILKYQE